MIREIGCTNDGGVWMSLYVNIKGENLQAIIPMDADKAKEIYYSIGKAISDGATWKETGVKPNVANSTGTDKGKPPGD